MTSEPEGPALSDAELAARRATLDQHLDERRAREVPLSTKLRPGMQAMAQGMKIASEFVAGITVGALLGYGIDYVFGTRPFGLVIFLFLGFAAGVLNVVRGAQPKPPTP